MTLVVLCVVHMNGYGSVPVFVSYSIPICVLVKLCLLEGVRVYHNENVSIYYNGHETVMSIIIM